MFKNLLLSGDSDISDEESFSSFRLNALSLSAIESYDSPRSPVIDSKSGLYCGSSRSSSSSSIRPSLDAGLIGSKRTFSTRKVMSPNKDTSDCEDDRLQRSRRSGRASAMNIDDDDDDDDDLPIFTSQVQNGYYIDQALRSSDDSPPLFKKLTAVITPASATPSSAFAHKRCRAENIAPSPRRASTDAAAAASLSVAMDEVHKFSYQRYQQQYRNDEEIKVDELE